MLEEVVLQDGLVDEPGVVEGGRGLVADGEAFARVHVGVECREADDLGAQDVLELVDEHGRLGHVTGQTGGFYFNWPYGFVSGRNQRCVFVKCL